MRVAFAAWLAFLISMSFSAAAEDAAQVPSAFDMLNAAAGLAADHADTRFAYTVDYWRRKNEEEVSVKVRYDPRLPEGKRWRLVEGALEDLNDDMRDEIKDLEKRDRPDDKLVYDKIGDVMESMELIEETDAHAVFRGPLIDDGVPENAVQATFTLNKTTGHIERIEASALEPFKPAPIAKIKKFYQDQRYAPPVDGGPALLSGSESDVSGKAVFKKFSVQQRRRFSDIELVDPVDIPSTE